MGMKTKIEKIAYGFLILVFVFTQIVCRTLETSGNMMWNVKSFLAVLGISFLCVIVFFFSISLIRKIRKKFGIKITHKEKNDAKRNSGKMFFVSWSIIFVCWLPMFFAYYPGILAYDSYVQIEQIMSGVYNNHHPLIHTFVVEAFMKIGESFGNMNLGVALYTLIQMLSLSVSMATGVYILDKRGGKRVWLWLLTLYFGLCPANGYMALSMTKDVFFTVFVLFFIYSLLHLLDEEQPHIMWSVAYVIVTTFMMMFRNNGRYAMLVFVGLAIVLLGLCFFVNKKKKEIVDKINYKRIFSILGQTVVSLILSSVLLTAMANHVSAQEGDKREMLSIPIQQIARSMIYHGGLDIVETDDATISEADKSLINEFLLYNGYMNYNPIISDPVKRCTNTWVVLNKMKEFISMYMRLLLDYPEEYINAFLAVNGGYLSVLDESHSRVNLSEGVMGLGYLQTRWEESTIHTAGIYKDSKMPGLYEILEKFSSENSYLKIPVVRNLVAPGIYIWGFAILGIWTFFKREKKYQLPLFFVLGYYMTLLLGPTVQLRYLYPVMLLLPFVYLYIWRSKRLGM